MKQAYLEFENCIKIEPRENKCKSAFAQIFAQYQPNNKYTKKEQKQVQHNKKKKWLRNNNYPKLAKRVR